MYTCIVHVSTDVRILVKHYHDRLLLIQNSFVYRFSHVPVLCEDCSNSLRQDWWAGRSV